MRQFWMGVFTVGLLVMGWSAQERRQANVIHVRAPANVSLLALVLLAFPPVLQPEIGPAIGQIAVEPKISGLVVSFVNEGAFDFQICVVIVADILSGGGPIP
jgi:hypothetical protein